MPQVFPDQDIQSIAKTITLLRNLSELTVQVYDCCPNSCIAYTGPWAQHQSCPHCKSPRLKNGVRQKAYSYIPLIPQLQALYSDPATSKLLRYRSSYFTPGGAAEAGKIKDVFDGARYKHLIKTEVIINNRRTGLRFFQGTRDLALGLSTDGFSPFKRRKHSAWPFLTIIYNFPPPIRNHLVNLFSTGCGGGPKAIKEMDSFLWPYVDELLSLAAGVPTLDADAKETFLLRAHLLDGFGDIPAVAKMMRMKGHNGLKPCRCCNIIGLSIPNSRNPAHYVPLDRTSHPDHGDIPVYDAAHLPMRTHDEMFAQGKEVEFNVVPAQAAKLSTLYGINGLTVLTRLPSISLSESFPIDFMHLIWENLIPNLVLHWTGDFKGLDSDGFCFEKTVWNAISAAGAASGQTIPSQHGAKVPHFAVRKGEMTAETWSFWTLHLAPILLFNQFTDDAYYTHFVTLVKFLHLYMQWEISTEEVDELEVGLRDWVIEYERYVPLQ